MFYFIGNPEHYQLPIEKAVDYDVTFENSLVYYELNSAQGITIDQESGIISFNISSLENVISENVELVVVASDSGNPKLSTPCIIIMQFRSLETYPTYHHHEIFVKEDSNIGTKLFELEDAQFVTFSNITGRGSEFFAISGQHLVLAKTLDREKIER